MLSIVFMKLFSYKTDIVYDMKDISLKVFLRSMSIDTSRDDHCNFVLLSIKSLTIKFNFLIIISFNFLSLTTPYFNSSTPLFLILFCCCCCCSSIVFVMSLLILIFYYFSSRNLLYFRI